MIGLISFSLFGHDQLYLSGAIANAKLAPTIYPGWCVRIYCGVEIPQDLKKQLIDLGCNVVIKPHVLGTKAWPLKRDELSKFGKFWRMLALADTNYDFVVCRDIDSRLNVRERAAVDAWISSGRRFHVMRDLEIHHTVSAGCFGAKSGSLPIESLIAQWPMSGKYPDDEQFLLAKAWPLMKDDVLYHGCGGIPFPPHPPFDGYVGQVIK